MLSMLLAITRSHHKDLNGPGYWAVGNLVIGLGMVLVLLQIDAPKAIFLPGMALIGAGLCLYINGIQAFIGNNPDYRIPIVVFILLAIIDIYFMLMHHNMQMAIVLSALIFSVIYLYSARLTFSRDDGLVGHFFWIVSSLYVLMALLMLGRSVYATRASFEMFESFATWPINAYTFMLGAVSQFFISSLFVLILSYKLNQNLESIATIDGLTSILNRRGLEDAAAKMQDTCKRINLSMTVILIDIDHFKKVNDKYGHLTGDDVLRHIANVIGGILRASDVFGRYGGEEFCAFLPNTTESDAIGLAERIRAAIEASPLQSDLALARGVIKTTISIGVADSVRAGYDFKGLVAAADGALYSAKKNGRNQVAGYTQTTRDTKLMF